MDILKSRIDPVRNFANLPLASFIIWQLWTNFVIHVQASNWVDTPKTWLKMRIIGGSLPFGRSTIVYRIGSNVSLLKVVRKITMANKMDLVEKVAQTIGCTKADAERAVESMIETITTVLKRGEEVSIAGLGIFEAKTRAGRTGRNPRTGATIQIKAMKVPKFRASKTLKDAIK